MNYYQIFLPIIITYFFLVCIVFRRATKKAYLLIN
ncbi:Uncharacterised protein [Legionella quinlivanii]|nr:Uncharacterised protein [Legionella quinlivanii]